MSTPLPPRPPAPGNQQGHLGLGIGLAWACLIGGYTVVTMLVGAVAQAGHGAVNDGMIIMALLLPWIVMVGLIIWLAARGKTRTAVGVAVGIGSIVAVALLLVAACFGLLSGTNFGR